MRHPVEIDLVAAMVELHKGVNRIEMPTVIVTYRPSNGILMVQVPWEHLDPQSDAFVKEYMRPFANLRALEPVWCGNVFTIFLHRSAQEGLNDCRRAVLAKVCERGPKTYDLETPPYSADFFLEGHP